MDRSTPRDVLFEVACVSFILAVQGFVGLGFASFAYLASWHWS